MRSNYRPNPPLRALRALFACFLIVSASPLAAETRTNILLITADDLGYEAVDFLGGEVPGVTPNLNRLAAQSLSFQFAHVNVAICAPSRSVIATGRYGHNSGLFGFNKLSRPLPTVFGAFQAAGYLTGVLGKVSHSTPDLSFKWDYVHDYGELGAGRSPSKYHAYCVEFFARCKREKKPFYFMVNSHDPHRPFHDPQRPMRQAEAPSRLFSPDEIAVPGFLPDLPGVRRELSHYYNSVRRFDDTVGKVLQALDESGLARNTLLVLITDNGSAFPFAKANTYLASTRTPCLVRWPGKVAPGTVDRTHFVSEVDFFPTFMEAASLEAPMGLDGDSLVPLLRGEKQAGRDFVFTQIDYTIGGPAKPMRCIQNKRYGYIFNAFSDGKFAYRNNNEGQTMKAMVEAGKTDPAIRARVDMFRHRVPQELYDLENDPSCTRNLIDSPAHREVAAQFQARLREWMVETKDHCLPAFDVRNDPQKLAAEVKRYPKLIKPKRLGDAKKPKRSAARKGRGKTTDEERAARRKARRAKQAAEQPKAGGASRASDSGHRAAGPISGDVDRLASAILEASGVAGGFIVHIDCGDAELTAALRMRDSFVVQGLSRDAAEVSAARARLRTRNERGAVTISDYDGDKLPYIENFVNLLVATGGSTIGADEILRVLTPHGVALVKGTVPNAAGASSVSIAGETWTRIVKPRPQAMDEWSHFLYDSSGNPVSRDTAVGPLKRYQWIAGPRWSRHHEHMASLSAMVSVDGRVFYIMDDGPRASAQLPAEWNLYARDAFNGTLLWRRPLKDWVQHLWPLKSGPTQLTRRLVAADGLVFVTLGLTAPVTALDPATGAVVREFPGTENATEIVHRDGKLFVVTEPEFAGLNRTAFRKPIGWDNKKVAAESNAWLGKERQSIVAFSVETGQRLWKRDGPVAPMSLAADADRLFCFDGTRVVGIEQADGSAAWEAPPIDGKRFGFVRAAGPRLLVHDDVVLINFSPSASLDLVETEDGEERLTRNRKSRRVVLGYSKKDGAFLWKAPSEPSGHESLGALFVLDDLVWTSGFRNRGDGRDPRTGDVERSIKKEPKYFPFHQRCYPTKAVGNYVLSGNPGIEMVDVTSGTWNYHQWTRGGCVYGVMPANGLVYTPPHACACYLESKTTGLCAMAPQSSATQSLKPDPDEVRLEKGPAYGKSRGAVSADDWPTFRGNGSRSGKAASIVPAKVSQQWSTDVGGTLTALTIAAGHVYVADKDAHRLVALGAGDGSIAWSFDAGGRIDSPPTVHDGKVLFGCADGWVYALRATDGVLAWRFRAAPVDRRMAFDDQIESVWPVHGSVLVHDGVLYCVAGRMMFLDGGLRLLKLDPETGRKLAEVVLDHTHPADGSDLQDSMRELTMPPALPDILSTDGRRLFMRSQPFDFDGKRPEVKVRMADVQAGPNAHLFATGGFLDGSWFHRTFWQYGLGVQSGCNFWFVAGRSVPTGRILVVDDDIVYGYGRQPAYMVWSTPLEYQLFAARKTFDAAWLQANAKKRRRTGPLGVANTFDRSKRLGQPTKAISGVDYVWQRGGYSMLVRGLVLAGDRLVVAGVPDVLDEEKLFYDYRAVSLQAKARAQADALAGKRGGVVRVVSTTDGAQESELALDSAPAWDGLAAAGGELFLSTLDGKVVCLGAR